MRGWEEGNSGREVLSLVIAASSNFVLGSRSVDALQIAQEPCVGGSVWLREKHKVRRNP